MPNTVLLNFHRGVSIGRFRADGLDVRYNSDGHAT